MHRILVMVFLAGVVLLRACQQQQGADLVPAVPAGAPNNVTGFCKSPNVAVRVQNIGRSAVNRETSVQVEFPSGPSTPQNVGPIPPGGFSEEKLFPIPANCFRPDCSFRITVDSGQAVQETNETNNTAPGRCIG
jgi:hypothetical protein